MTREDGERKEGQKKMGIKKRKTGSSPVCCDRCVHMRPKRNVRGAARHAGNMVIVVLLLSIALPRRLARQCVTLRYLPSRGSLPC